MLLRSRHYYRDRRREIPERSIQSLLASATSDPGLTFEDWATFAAPLTRAQVKGMPDYPVIPSKIAQLFTSFWNYNGLRLWAALRSDQHNRAAKDGGLAFTGMTPEQQRLFVQGFRGERRESFVKFLDHLRALDLRAASLTMKQAETSRFSALDGSEVVHSADTLQGVLDWIAANAGGRKLRPVKDVSHRAMFLFTVAPGQVVFSNYEWRSQVPTETKTKP